MHYTCLFSRPDDLQSDFLIVSDSKKVTDVNETHENLNVDTGLINEISIQRFEIQILFLRLNIIIITI